MTAPGVSLSWPRRLGAGFVLAVLVAGCVLLWVGVPIGAFRLAGELTSSHVYQAPTALVLLVLGMVAVAVGLAWVNHLWLRITGGEIVELRGVPVRRRGPLEILLPICGVIALVALVVWFFVAAENPSNRFF